MGLRYVAITRIICIGYASSIRVCVIPVIPGNAIYIGSPSTQVIPSKLHCMCPVRDKHGVTIVNSPLLTSHIFGSITISELCVSPQGSCHRTSL